MVNNKIHDKTHAIALDIVGLKKSYGSVEVLKSIDISMDEGDFLVLVGPSGCGKSTLLNCIAGLEEVSAGIISIGGRDVTQIPPKDRNIAMVFQSYALYPSMTVAENIAFGMKVRHVAKDESKAKTLEVARALQIEPLLDRKPGQLSGGQRQRVAMGRALVRDPELFLFDEPLSNLDAKLRVEMRGEIRGLHERLKASIVYVTHDQVEAMTLGTRIVVLKDGVVQQNGTPDEIYNRPDNLFVADFMGAPPMNLVPAMVRIDKKTTYLDFTSDGDEKNISLKLAINSGALSAYSGKKIIVGMRPEALRVHSEKKCDFCVVVSKTEHAGSDVFTDFKLGGVQATARLAGRTKIGVGETLNLTIEPGDICYFDPESELAIR